MEYTEFTQRQFPENNILVSEWKEMVVSLV